jgi:hypothetical protein
MKIVENTPKDESRNMSTCFKNGIRIIPFKYGNLFKIIVERNGKQKKGEDLYPEKSDKHTPGVYDKIHELYRQIANKIDTPQPLTPQQL